MQSLLNVRAAAEALAEDYSLVRCAEYPEAWTALLDALEDHEPVVRLYAIKVSLLFPHLRSAN